MTLRAAHAPLRIGLHGTLLLAMAAILLIFGPGRAMAAADPGTVAVYGYQWSEEYKVELDRLNGTPDDIMGEEVTTYSLLEVYEAAEQLQTSPGKDFTVASLSRTEIVFPRAQGKVTYTGNQIRNNPKNIARFYINENGFTVLYVPGMQGSAAKKVYDGSTPQLYEPKQALKSFSVSVSPRQKTVKSGTKVTLQASPQGLASGVSVSYSWSINGAIQSGNGSTFSTTYRGDSGDAFAVTVTASANGYNNAVGGAQVFIDKVEKKPKKKKPKDEQPSENTDDYTDPGYYPDYSYDDYYDDGSGPGTGSPNSGGTPSTPDRDKEPQQPPPADEPGETVTGQLIEPTQIATVVPPTETPGTATTQEAGPAEEDEGGGGGLSTGVKTALGIGALLGLGGLAEAGAFSGAIRRFRLRP